MQGGPTRAKVKRGGGGGGEAATGSSFRLLPALSRPLESGTVHEVKSLPIPEEEAAAADVGIAW